MNSAQSAPKKRPIVKTGIWGNLQKHCQKNARIDVPILKKVQKTNDTYVYTIGLPDPSLPLGLVTAAHIKIFANIATKKKPQGELINRMYSPISPDDQLGTFDLQFKVYKKSEAYPEGGLMSQYLESKNVGDKISITGPVVGLYYAAPGHFKIANLANMKFKNLGMICGGTGINVMYPVLRDILNNPADKTNVSLLFANRSEADILMKQELDGFQSDPRIKIHYIVNTVPSGWTGFEGHITKEMIEKTMPAAGKDTFMWVCGPVGMDKAVEKQLFALKHKKNQMMISSDLGYFGRHIMRSLCCCCCI